MKMYYGNVPVKSMKVGTNTDDATLVASDLQAGKTGYSMGRKVVGTGKAFSFATYGFMYTNDPWFIPTEINIIGVACVDYPVQLKIELNQMKNVDFTVMQPIADVIIDGSTYEITVGVIDSELTINCDKDIKLEVFYGKDEYA